MLSYLNFLFYLLYCACCCCSLAPSLACHSFWCFCGCAATCCSCRRCYRVHSHWSSALFIPQHWIYLCCVGFYCWLRALFTCLRLWMSCVLSWWRYCWWLCWCVAPCWLGARAFICSHWKEEKYKKIKKNNKATNQPSLWLERSSKMHKYVCTCMYLHALAYAWR